MTRVESPCWYYASTYDAEATIARHAYVSEPRADRLTNFLGVRIPADIFPPYLTPRMGEVESVPIPGNWHGDMAEWSAGLRAVELSGSNFRMIELGCGWGCWMNNLGMAARHLEKTIELIGIEGDPGHFDFAQKILSDNGFSETEYKLLHGIAAGRSGYALFPKQDVAGQHWGLEPLFLTGLAERDAALSSGRYHELPMVSLNEVCAGRRIDLLHMDIQGGEADLVNECMSDLDAYVATMLIGTHGREIEGRLMTNLASHGGWMLEMEKPAMLGLNDSGSFPQMDGVQFWRNRRLIPDG